MVSGLGRSCGGRAIGGSRARWVSDASEINEAQGHVFLRVDGCVEVADYLLSLSLRIRAVIFDSCRCHHWRLGGLAVLGLPVARGEAKAPAPSLKVLRWDKPIVGSETVLALEALDSVAGQEIVAGLVKIPSVLAKVGLVASAKELRQLWGLVHCAQAV